MVCGVDLRDQSSQFEKIDELHKPQFAAAGLCFGVLSFIRQALFLKLLAIISLLDPKFRASCLREHYFSE